MITPLEISKIEFSKNLRGYNTEEVNSTLQVISKTLEKHLSEKTDMQSKINVLQAKLESFKQVEVALQDSALMMQSLLEEKKKEANREAQLIIDDANQRASMQVNEYEGRVLQLKKDVEYLYTQKQDYFIKFKHFVNSQKDWLEAMEEAQQNKNRF